MFANKVVKRLREKINTELPRAYPRAFTWAVYSSDGAPLLRRTPDDAKKQESDKSPVSAATVGTALTRLLEAAVGFANTVTSGSDSTADIVHVAGSKFLFTAARFGKGFVLTFFSTLTDAAPSASPHPSSKPASPSGKAEAAEDGGKAEAAEKPGAVSHMIDDEDFAQSAFGGDELLRKLLSELDYIITDVKVGSVKVPQAGSSSTSSSSSSAARRISTDESQTTSTSSTQPSNTVTTGHKAAH